MKLTRSMLVSVSSWSLILPAALVARADSPFDKPFHTCTYQNDGEDTVAVQLFAYSEGIAAIKVMEKFYLMDKRLSGRLNLPLAAAKELHATPGGVQSVQVSYKSEFSVALKFQTEQAYASELKLGARKIAISCKQAGEGNDDTANDEKVRELDGQMAIAARKGDLAEVKRLHEREGARIDGQHNGQKALMEAVVNGKLPVARYLLENGADANQEALINGGDLLNCLISAKRDDAPMAKLLLESKVNTALGRSGWTALQYAAYSNLPKILALLLKVPGAMIQDEKASALALAASRAGVEATELLIKAQAELDWKDPRSQNTPLMRAMNTPYIEGPETTLLRRQEKVVRLLIAAGADVNAATNDGWTALHIAAGRTDVNKVDLLTQLIAAKAHVNARAKQFTGESTPLSEATEARLPENIKALKKAGATR